MEEVGKILKEQRVKLGLTLDDIYEKTKITPIKVKAIENGDISFFKHELSYLKFYIQYYARSLDIPYEDLEESLNNALDSYSDTILIKRDEKKIVSNENIQRRMDKNKERYNVNNKFPLQQKKRRFDISSIVLVLLMIVVAALLVYGFVEFVIPMINRNPVVEIPNVPEVPDPPVDNDNNEPIVNVVPENNDNEEPAVVDITEVNHQIGSSLTLDVNLNGIEDARFKIETGSDTWLRFSIDGQPTSNPLDTVYVSGSSVELRLDAATQQNVSLRVGTMVNNKFFINDQPIAIPEESVNHPSGFTITLNLIGE